jgi:Domain of unknown function (DUF397)
VTKPNPTNVVWRKSSRSENTSSGTCVEVASISAHVAVRDSQNPNNANLTFPSSQWHNFIRGVKHGEFDL